ncbi:MAG TPA: hypothetical protein VF017_23685 [Thermoanaerobaculia bacterium]|nr:hypothetical protein [Thermoanaerobaculia bacterium]
MLVVAEVVTSRRYARFLLQLAALGGAALLLRLWIGFPRLADGGRRSFGAEANAWLMIGLIFGCILVGIAAHHVFFLKGAFSWAKLLKSLLISPIILLPLVGSLQDTSSFGPMQIFSFCLLAFQNGFFWRIALEGAQATLKP